MLCANARTQQLTPLGMCVSFLRSRLYAADIKDGSVGPAASSSVESATGGAIDAYETVLKSATEQVSFTSCLDTKESVPLNLVASA